MRPSTLLTQETEQKIFTQTILPLIMAGDSITIMWVPRGGRRRSMVYLVKNSQKLGFQKLSKYLISYIDLDELTKETPEAYFSLMINQIKEELKKTSPKKLPFPSRPSDKPFPFLKSIIKKLLKQNYHLIFIPGRFDQIPFPKTFFNNLAHLWRLDKSRVHFIFPIYQDLFKEKKIECYGGLSDAISQNLICFPLFSDKDQDYTIERISLKYRYKVSSKTKALVKKFSGGNPSLIRACCRIITKNPNLRTEEEIADFLSRQYETRLIFEDIWNSLEKDEQEAVSSLAQELSLKLPQIPQRLLRLRIIDQNNNLELFSPLFASFVKTKGKRAKSLSLDRQNGQILIDGLPSQAKITLKEYHLLSAFLEKPNALFSRDDIAEILWGKESYDKYSNWAIDQIISQLRKKLFQLGVPSSNLQTIRKRGYRWLEENEIKDRS